jgi:hypothetical protein
MATEIDQSQRHLIGSSPEHDSFVSVLLPPTNSLERKRPEQARIQQSWQRVKAINSPEKFPSIEKVKKRK